MTGYGKAWPCRTAGAGSKQAMRRRDNDYRQWLRKDKRSNAAAIVAAFARPCCDHDRHPGDGRRDLAESRAYPLYWVQMPPGMW